MPLVDQAYAVPAGTIPFLLLMNEAKWNSLSDAAKASIMAHGGLTRANGQRFRDMILSKGHTEDYAPMFKAFYGKDPDIGPMLEDRGLTATAK